MREATNDQWHKKIKKHCGYSAATVRGMLRGQMWASESRNVGPRIVRITLKHNGLCYIMS